MILVILCTIIPGPQLFDLFCHSMIAHEKSESIVHVEIPDLFDQSMAAPVFNCLAAHDRDAVH